MSRSIDVVRLSGDEYDRLIVQVNKLDAVRRAAKSLCDDAEEYECDGLGLFAQHGAWEPLHDALEQIDNEDQVIDTTNGGTECAECHLQAMRDCTRMAQAFGTSMAQAAAALQAFGAAAKALEEETKAMLEARRARQPWWRRGRW
jgi:hypothetical protein